MTYSQYPPRQQQWRNGDNREETVHNLVHTYQSLRERSPALHYLARDPVLYRLFCEIIGQQINLIRSRHQKIDDGHITVFDKALCILSQERNSIDLNLGVQELYIREYIGINPEAATHVIEETLARNIWIKGILTKCAPSVPVKREPPTADAETVEEHHQHRQGHPPQGHPPYPHTVLWDYNISNDPVAADNKNILRKYFEAKREFYNLTSTNYEEKAVAAKYLRDTAENARRYVTSEHLLQEIDEVFEYAKKRAEEFLGGKKRRFEVEQLQRGVRSRRRASVRYSPYHSPRHEEKSFAGGRQTRYKHHS